MKHYLVLIALLLLPLTSNAQESGWAHFKSWAKLFLDSTDVAGCNLSYVRPYERPRTISVSLRQFGTDFNTQMNSGSKAKLHAGTKSNLKFKLDYRGYGLSYSFELRNGTEREFSLSKRGAVYGLEMRTYSSHSLHGIISAESSYNIQSPYEYYAQPGSLRKHSFELNGYYIIRHKTFSYPAAITGTVRQIKSCGSPILAFTYYRATTKSKNDALTYHWDDIRKINLDQLSVGGGYGYNFVFGHNSCFLIHASAMPMLSFYRRNKLHTAHSSRDIEEDSYFDTEHYRQYFNSLRDKSTSLKITAIMRGSFLYTWGNSLVGYRVSFNRTDVGSFSKFRITNTDWNGDLYLGYRF